MSHRPGRATGALVLALVGGVLIALWMLAITVIVVQSIGRHTDPVINPTSGTSRAAVR